MGMRPLTEHLLKPADRVEVTVLVDNYIDIFVPPATAVDRRLPFAPDRQIMAEHGFSCLVRVVPGKKEHTVLLDTGLSRDCMAWNARQLGVDLHAVEAVVLSHGHFDHTGGLSAVFCGAGRQVPLVVHPDAFLRRRMNGPKGIAELPGWMRSDSRKPGPTSCSARGPRPLRPATCS